MLEMTNIAETAPDHADPKLRTRRYQTVLDLKTIRQTIETVVPTLRKYGGKWKLAASKNGDRSDEREIIRVEVPVVVFTDDLTITLQREAGAVVVNVHSKSRIGKSDLGENRRHIIQLLKTLDERFGGNANS